MSLYDFCQRFVHHWWRELEPGVKRCRVCRCMQFDAATDGQLDRWWYE